jgi:hypothetical protein
VSLVHRIGAAVSQIGMSIPAIGTVPVATSYDQTNKDGHYVEWTDHALYRRRSGPMLGYQALRYARDLVADPGCTDVVYIARTGARYGESEIAGYGRGRE